jgi:hypothetical protein
MKYKGKDFLCGNYHLFHDDFFTTDYRRFSQTVSQIILC